MGQVDTYVGVLRRQSKDVRLWNELVRVNTVHLTITTASAGNLVG